MGRTAEINAIRELAVNIAENLGEGTADELVDYALSDEGRESWGIDIELDDHDRGLLVRFVSENLGTSDKEFTVTYGLKCYPHQATVTLNGVLASDPITPAMAARAARVACGHRDGVTVWSNDEHGYRLYARSARKVFRDG